MLQVITQAGALVLIVFLGFLFKRIGWAKPEHFAMLTKVVLYLTLPAMLLTAFNDITLTPQLLLLAGFGFALTMGLHLLGYWMERKGPPRERAFGLLNVSSFNLGIFTTPYLAMFIGAHAIIYSSMFDIGVSIASAGVAYSWALAITSESGRFSLRTFLVSLPKNPVLVTYVVLLAMRAFNISLPEAALTLIAPIGSANAFVAMLMVGIGLEIRLNPAKYARAMKYLAMRYSAVIVAGVGVWFLMPVDQEIRVIVCAVLASPIAVMTAAFTLETNGDTELSAFMISVSILVAIVAMPTLFLLLS